MRTGWLVCFFLAFSCTGTKTQTSVQTEASEPVASPGEQSISKVQRLLLDAQGRSLSGDRSAALKLWREAYDQFGQEVMPAIRARSADESFAFEVAFGAIHTAIDSQRGRLGPAIKRLDGMLQLEIEHVRATP